MANQPAYTSFALPADLSEEIDTVAKGLGLHRSEFVEQAIQTAMDEYNKQNN